MKRYYDIDPLFNQARRLPMEVSIEQVQGFLATSAMPAGASKSWFNSLNFYIMLGIITGAIALLTITSGESQITSIKAANAPGLTLTELHTPATSTLKTQSKKSTIQYASVADTTIQVQPVTPVEPAIVLKKSKIDLNETKIELKNERVYIQDEPDLLPHLVIDPVADLLLVDPLPLSDFYGGAYDDLPVTGSDIAFMITNESTYEDVTRILGEGRKTNVRVSNMKVKYKRNGKIKVMKLAFAVPHSNTDCDWKIFRTVELKGFKTYEYGWTVNENGDIINFWEKLNNKEPSIVPVPQKACGKVKYFCNN